MGKGLMMVLGIIFLLVVIVGFYSGFFGRLTGRVVDAERECTDGDEGKEFYEKGVTRGQGEADGATRNFTDFCFGVEIVSVESCKGPVCRVNEYYCGFRNFVYEVEAPCPNGCKDGACLSKQVIVKTIVNETNVSEVNDSELQEPENETGDEQIEGEMGNEELAEELPETDEKKTSIFSRIANFFKNLFR